MGVSSIALFGGPIGSTNQNLTVNVETVDDEIVGIQTVGVEPIADANEEISTSNYTVDIRSERSQWFTSPTMSSTFQQISFERAENMSINYVLTTATNISDLHGQTILVDDINPEIAWTGSWENKTEITFGTVRSEWCILKAWQGC
ncbi:hypothetical protein VKT23_013871 [Stygiomarasmius scandens]|uniref:Uncharacterized protein n=1 Tax=Marasmiellus scandens TaxID=2682957 RepID=A0ABR1J5E4_9AGAR